MFVQTLKSDYKYCDIYTADLSSVELATLHFVSQQIFS